MSRKTKNIITQNHMSSGASKIKALLIAGADVNTRFEEGITPLMSASVDGDVATVEVLLKAGADIELQQDYEGMTALMKAALWKKEKVAAKLISAGAQINKATRHGWTALMYAALAGDSHTIQHLLRAGADTKMKDHWDKTALDYALEKDMAKQYPFSLISSHDDGMKKKHAILFVCFSLTFAELLR